MTKHGGEGGRDSKDLRVAERISDEKKHQAGAPFNGEPAFEDVHDQDENPR